MNGWQPRDLAMKQSSGLLAGEVETDEKLVVLPGQALGNLKNWKKQMPKKPEKRYN